LIFSFKPKNKKLSGLKHGRPTLPLSIPEDGQLMNIAAPPVTAPVGIGLHPLVAAIQRSSSSSAGSTCSKYNDVIASLVAQMTSSSAM
jgi:hypothetical protein